MTILLGTFNYENHIYKSVVPKNSITQAGSSSSGKGTSVEVTLSEKYFIAGSMTIPLITQFVNCNRINLLSFQITILWKISNYILQIQRLVLPLKITI